MAGTERSAADARVAMVAEALARVQPAMKPRPEPLPEREPEPEPEMMAAPPPESEPEPEPVMASALDEAAPPEPPAEAPLSDEDIERILNAKPEPEPDPVQSLVDAEAEEQETIRPEDIPDPEPLPEVFTATDGTDVEEPRGGKGWRKVVAVIVVLAAVAAGLYFGRGLVVSVWPGAEPLYAMAGIDVQKLGAGLELLDLRNEWATEGGQKELVVSGVIANTSEQERAVPMLRIELRDGRDEVVQVYVYPPEKTRLAAGERLSFRAHVGEVMMTARRTHVLWTDELPPDTGKGPEKPAS